MAMPERHQPMPTADRAVVRRDPELVVTAWIVRLAFNYTGHINVDPDLVPVLAGERGVRE
jgi:hypothetical protein